MYRSTSPDDASQGPTGAVPTIFEAIVKQRCINATWNRDWFVLAPHVIYTRHGEVFVDAITVARNGMLPREEKLGTFKVVGLGDPRLTGREFVPSKLFEPEAEKYAGVTLMTVEADAA